MNNSIVSNFIWRFAERCGAQLVSFVVSIVLARLLLPEMYGTIALITVFTTILNVFVDSGLGNALIQKKDADEVDFSTVFYFNICMCLFLYTLIFFSAPIISKFYKDESLVSLIRVLSLTIVISGVKNVQQAYVSKTMQFKKFFFATLFGTSGAAVIGVVMAYNGFGVWALVAQQIFNITLDTIILWLSVKWRPQKSFSFERLKNLFSFGWKLLVSALIDTIYNDIRQLIIGKMYTKSDLALYNRGQQLPNFIVSNINTSIDSVLLPAMSNEQDNKSRVKAMTRRAMKISVFIMAPLMIGLACCADAIVKVLLTDKWIGCVPFLRIFCITYILFPIHTANLNAIKAMGRSDIILKLEIIKKIIGTVLLVSSMWFGVKAMAYSMLINGFIGQIINSSPNKKLLDYGYIEQIKDIIPSIIAACIMGACVYSIRYLHISVIMMLCLQIVFGVVSYLIVSKIMRSDSLDYLFSIMKNSINNGEV